MAFHLKMSDLERARQVAERAVKHVTWTAGLNGQSVLTVAMPQRMLQLFGASDLLRSASRTARSASMFGSPT